MNRTVKHIIGCLATLAMIVVGAQRLGHLVRPVVFNLSGAYTKIDSFHSMPEHSIEVIAYGSSHTYKSIDPMVMYRDYGIGAYNYGYNWQRLNTTKLFLQESLSKRGYSFADAMTEYAREKGCVYINMFDHMEECGLDSKTDFRDAGHTNSRGAAKISAYLGKYLSEYYDLTDMRQVENNPWSKVK